MLTDNLYQLIYSWLRTCKWTLLKEGEEMKRISSDPSHFEFDRFFRETIEFEGGGNNGSQHSLDKGGYTKYGLASRSHPSLDLKSLTLEQAKTIYYDEYWRKARCDELPTSIAGYFFDTCVNCGISGGTKILQLAIRNQLSIDLAPDGIIGPETLRYAKQLDISRFKFWRIKHYFDIVNKRPSQMVFLYGWYRRATEYGL